MKVKDLISELNLKLFAGAAGLEREVTGGYTSDLLSDVMGFASCGETWVTLQTHKNVVAIATLKELSAVVLVKDLQPNEETCVHADSENIPLLGTSDSTFEFTGKLYKLLN